MTVRLLRQVRLVVLAAVSVSVALQVVATFHSGNTQQQPRLSQHQTEAAHLSDNNQLAPISKPKP